MNMKVGIASALVCFALACASEVSPSDLAETAPVPSAVASVIPTPVPAPDNPTPTTPPASASPNPNADVPPTPTQVSEPESNDEEQVEPSPVPQSSPTPVDPTATQIPPALNTPTPPVAGTVPLQTTTIFGPVECEGTGRVTFDHFPLDAGIISSIQPMGDMSGSHVTPVDHIYITHDSADVPGHGYEVVMPADGVVVSVGRMPNPNRPDYRIVIAHTCTLFTTFIHVGSPVEELMAKVGELELGSSWYGAHAIQAGQKLADASTNTMDFMVHDAEVTLPGFVSPALYENEPWKIHTLDPFDFYDEPLRSAVLAFNPRTAEPVGGKIDYDIDGRLVGNWFVEDTNGYTSDGRLNYWETHLAIAYDYIDPSMPLVSIGADFGIPDNACNVCAGAFAIKGNALDPATISTSDGLVKYELVGRIRPFPGAPMFNDESNSIGVMLVEMLDDRTLRFEVIPGVLPESLTDFTDAALIYTR